MKSNYEILGLSDNASTELVKRKYDALCRQYKQKTEKGVSEDDALYYEEITSAYNSIMGYDKHASLPVSPLRRFSESVSAFFNQYFFIIAVVGVLIIFGITVFYQMQIAKKDDLGIKFVGAYSSSDVSKLQDELNAKFESVQSPTLSFFTVYEKTNINRAVLNNQQKFILELSRGTVDVLFVDKDVYDAYVCKGAFYRLDDYIKNNNREADWSRLNLLKYTPKEDETVAEGTYGIDVKNATFLEGMTFNWLDESEDKTMILVICNSSKLIDNSFKFTEEVISTIPK